MPKLYVRISSHNSSYIFIVIVKVPQIFFSQIYFKGILIFVKLFRPIVYCDDFVEAHDDIDDDVFVFETSFSTLDDGFAHVQIGESTTVDEDLFVEPYNWENDRYTC